MDLTYFTTCLRDLGWSGTREMRWPRYKGSFFRSSLLVPPVKDLMNKIWASQKEGFEWCGQLANSTV